ncbi:phosphotransferase family protein [Nocardioides bigeumensis]|uniref:Phosphotransferase family protein n=1 Tax=Nocardioides bigeumensis TaxID=433657 RepID=A0ABN2YXN7_9ACTN
MSDEPVALRDEDAFDVGAVTVWLRAAVGDEDAGVVAGEPEVRQYPGGASNLTYLLRFPAGDLVLRRPPVGAKARGAHDMGREFRIQAALRPVFPKVPRMVAHCDDDSVLGSEFYVMERVVGEIPRRELPWPLDAAACDALCARAWGLLVDLHSVDVAAVPELAALGRGEGYVARQVAGWTERLARAATHDLGAWGSITTWLDDVQPPDAGVCLIHNDFRLDNLVLTRGAPRMVPEVAAVLDWELATVGDPLMDLGGALAYWIEAGDDDAMQRFRRQPSHLPGMWTRAEVVAQYAAATGRVVSAEAWRFYEVFGLFRLAVIAQQIWYRYALGETTNPAYAVFGPAVEMLRLRCLRLIEGRAASG